MICPKCNGQQNDGVRFCSDCGLFLEPFNAETEKDVAPASTPLDDSSSGEAQDPRIKQVFDGKYKIVRLLGEGGMGTVYVAHRLYLDDTVAIKILLTKHFADEEVVERFRREAITAASIRHPNIVSVYDAGGSFDQSVPPYIVMELVRGTSLDKLLKLEGKLDPSRAARLMREICNGVGAAHRHKIWHRDLKPANILVLPPDPDEGRENETVKIIDFGIAKLRKLDIKTLTIKGLGVLGSPPYMAPEQWRAGEADARSDVYNLGSTLYEMLNGTPPFVSTTREDLCAQHLYRPPPPLPRELGVPRSLEATIMRALEKDPEARQQNVADFAREIQAAMAGHVDAAGSVSPHAPSPISASSPPLSKARHSRQWWGIAVALLSVWLILVFWEAMKIAKANPPEDTRGGEPTTSTPAAPPRTPSLTVTPLRELQLGRELFEIALNNDGKLIASVADGELEVRLWQVKGDAELRPLRGATGPGQCIAFSPDGNTIASGNNDGVIRLWRLDNDGAPVTLKGHSSSVFLVRFNADSSTLVSASLDRTVRKWRLSDGKEIDKLQLPSEQFVVNHSPNQALVALYKANDKGLGLWSFREKRPVVFFTDHRYEVRFGTYSPDGAVLAVGSTDKSVRLWRTRDGSLMRSLGESQEGFGGAVFSPDGQRIVTGRNDGFIQMWQVSDGALLKEWAGHKKAVHTLSFSADGRVLATGSDDGHIRLWEVREEL